MTFTNLNSIVPNFRDDVVECIQNVRFCFAGEVQELYETRVLNTALDLIQDDRPDCTDRLVSSWTLNYTPVGRDVLVDNGDSEDDANNLSYNIHQWAIPTLRQFEFPQLDEELVPITVYLNNGVWYSDDEARSYYPNYITGILFENFHDIALHPISWEHTAPTTRDG